jgi:hypothetical protein
MPPSTGMVLHGGGQQDGLPVVEPGVKVGCEYATAPTSVNRERMINRMCFIKSIKIRKKPLSAN